MPPWITCNGLKYWLICVYRSQKSSLTRTFCVERELNSSRLHCNRFSLRCSDTRLDFWHDRSLSEGPKSPACRCYCSQTEGCFHARQLPRKTQGLLLPRVFSAFDSFQVSRRIPLPHLSRCDYSIHRAQSEIHWSARHCLGRLPLDYSIHSSSDPAVPVLRWSTMRIATIFMTGTTFSKFTFKLELSGRISFSRIIFQLRSRTRNCDVSSSSEIRLSPNKRWHETWFTQGNGELFTGHCRQLVATEMKLFQHIATLRYPMR